MEIREAGAADRHAVTALALERCPHTEPWLVEALFSGHLVLDAFHVATDGDTLAGFAFCGSIPGVPRTCGRYWSRWRPSTRTRVWAASCTPGCERPSRRWRPTSAPAPSTKATAQIRGYAFPGESPLASLARVGGVPAAICYLLVGPGGEEASVVYTGVDPQFRGRGLGRTVKEDVHMRAHASGVLRLVTDNEEHNAGIRRLNDEMGFVKV